MSPLPLACPTCLDRLTVPEVFEEALAAQPELRLVTFLCPLCGAPGIARLGDGLAETGRLDERGAFRVLSFEVAPELAVAPQRRALRIWLLGRRRDVPVPQDAPSGPPPAQPGT